MFERKFKFSAIPFPSYRDGRILEIIVNNSEFMFQLGPRYFTLSKIF